MTKSIVSFLTFSILFGCSVSFGYTFLKIGIYEERGLKVEVALTKRTGIYQVHAVATTRAGAAQREDFFINVFTWEVFKSPLGVEAIDMPNRPGVRSYKPIEMQVYPDGILMAWQSGGFFQKFNEYVSLVVAPEEGSILAIDVFNKSAKWTLPKGINLPFKKIVQDFKCSTLMNRL